MSSALTGCPADDATPPSWEEFKADATRVLDGREVYLVEWDRPVSEAELRDYYDRHIIDDGFASTEQASLVDTSMGRDSVWTDGKQLDLSYCVTDDFGADKARVVAEMAQATADWERVANIRFRYRSFYDGYCSNQNATVTFAVRPWPPGFDRDGAAACAFHGPLGNWCVERTLVIDLSELDDEPYTTTVGVFRHELGHILGLRHEHERPESGGGSKPCGLGNGGRELTTYDRASVMHYPECNGIETSNYPITPLDAAGVQALYGPPNLAIGKVATQISTPAWGGPAARAVDGRIDGNWAHDSVTHTDVDAQPWWQVDLGMVRNIGEVVIYNRTDADSDRLSDFDVQVSNDGVSWRVVAAVTGDATARTRISIDAAARFVRIQLRGIN